jgi:hypothetical protein
VYDWDNSENHHVQVNTALNNELSSQRAANGRLSSQLAHLLATVTAPSSSSSPLAPSSLLSSLPSNSRQANGNTKAPNSNGISRSSMATNSPSPTATATARSSHPTSRPSLLQGGVVQAQPTVPHVAAKVVAHTPLSVTGVSRHSSLAENDAKVFRLLYWT